MQAPASVAAQHDARTLLLVGPDLDSAVADEAIASYRGAVVAHVGPRRDRTSAASALPADDWSVETSDPLTSWSGRPCALTVYRRR